MRTIKGMILLTSVVLFVAWVAGAAQGVEGKKGKSAPLKFERGKVVYLANCARCHGADGLGQTTMGKMVEAPDISDAKWQSKRGKSRMISSVSRGRGQMPAFAKKLTKDEIATAVAYVRTLRK